MIKRILAILAAPVLCFSQGSTNDYIFQQKPATGPLVVRPVTPSVGKIIGWPSSINTPAAITIGSGLSLTGSTLTATGGTPAWGDITGIPAAITALSSATAAGLALMDDASAAAQRTTLGLGTLATQSGALTDSQLNLTDPTSDFYVQLEPSGGMAANRNITFPDASGELLLSNGNGSALTALNASNIASGSLAIARIAQGGATSGQAIAWNGATWAPATVSAGGSLTVYTLPTSISWTGGGCYALNKLVAAYSGYAIKLIRASDSDQEDFGFLNDGKFDLPAYLTWVSGTTAKVVTWYDQSGNGNNATQSTDANRPEFNINVQGQPVVYFRDADFTPQFYLTLPSGITNNLINLTQITVARCIDELQSTVSGPVWPAFGVGTAFSAYGASDGVVEITSPNSTQGLYDRSLNGNPVVYLSLYPSTSRLEAIGIYNTGTGSSSSDQRYITSTYRSPLTVTGSISVWKNTGVAQLPVGGRLGCRGDGGVQSQAEAVCMLVARSGSISQTEEMMTAIKQSFGLRPRPKRILWWCGDSLAAGYEGGYDFKGRSPGVLCDAMQNDYVVFTFAKAGKRWDQLDSDAASSTNGIDPWLTAAETKMPKAADIFALLGTNDLNASANGGSAASLATIQSRCNTFIAARKASGAGRVFVGTIPSAGSYITTDATRTDYNAWLLAGSSSADGVVDLASLNWVGKMQGDGVHWTAEGNAMAAQAVADFLMSQN